MSKEDEVVKIGKSLLCKALSIDVTNNKVTIVIYLIRISNCYADSRLILSYGFSLVLSTFFTANIIFHCPDAQIQSNGYILNVCRDGHGIGSPNCYFYG